MHLSPKVPDSVDEENAKSRPAKRSTMGFEVLAHDFEEFGNRESRPHGRWSGKHVLVCHRLIVPGEHAPCEAMAPRRSAAETLGSSTSQLGVARDSECVRNSVAEISAQRCSSGGNTYSMGRVSGDARSFSSTALTSSVEHLMTAKRSYATAAHRPGRVVPSSASVAG